MRFILETKLLLVLLSSCICISSANPEEQKVLELKEKMRCLRRTREHITVAKNTSMEGYIVERRDILPEDIMYRSLNLHPYSKVNFTEIISHQINRPFWDDSWSWGRYRIFNTFNVNTPGIYLVEARAIAPGSIELYDDQEQHAYTLQIIKQTNVGSTPRVISTVVHTALSGNSGHTVTAVLHLVEGDRVYVKSLRETTLWKKTGSAYFTLALLQPDCSTEPVCGDNCPDSIGEAVARKIQSIDEGLNCLARQEFFMRTSYQTDLFRHENLEWATRVDSVGDPSFVGDNPESPHFYVARVAGTYRFIVSAVIVWEERTHPGAVLQIRIRRSDHDGSNDKALSSVITWPGRTSSGDSLSAVVELRPNDRVYVRSLTRSRLMRDIYTYTNMLYFIGVLIKPNCDD